MISNCLKNCCEHTDKEERAIRNPTAPPSLLPHATSCSKIVLLYVGTVVSKPITRS